MAVADLVNVGTGTFTDADARLHDAVISLAARAADTRRGEAP